MMSVVYFTLKLALKTFDRWYKIERYIYTGDIRMTKHSFKSHLLGILSQCNFFDLSI